MSAAAPHDNHSLRRSIVLKPRRRFLEERGRANTVEATPERCAASNHAAGARRFSLPGDLDVKYAEEHRQMTNSRFPQERSNS